jgi:hypothetical protein
MKHAKTGKILRITVQIPHPYQMPHHMEDLERQIPYSLEKTWSQIPGICPGGGVLKFRIDRYITNWVDFKFSKRSRYIFY